MDISGAGIYCAAKAAIDSKLGLEQGPTFTYQLDS